MANKFGLRATDLQGLAALATDATLGIANTVEAMHSRISDVATGRGLTRHPASRARGIAGLVYRQVRATTAGVGWGVRLGFAAAAKRWPGATTPSSPQRDAVLAAVNGVFGDHLLATQNPLAVPMQLLIDGQCWRRALAAAPSRTRSARLVILVHGLCMSPGQWRRAAPQESTSSAHDHGHALHRDFAVQPIYAFYNSGCSISTNASALARELDELVNHWPQPVTEVSLVGHSMGGLVARGALWHAERAAFAWRTKSRRLMCLGTPHDGAPLEKIGSWADAALTVSRWSAPLATLTLARSAGIHDLRCGRIWQKGEQTGSSVGPPLPSDVDCYALAGRLVSHTKGSALTTRLHDSVGDGLVTVASALGRKLQFLPERQRVIGELGHLDLLGELAYPQLREWW